MHFLTIARAAVTSLKRAPLRSALTALGIIIGVAAVIAVISIGSGAKLRMQAALARPDSKLVTLTAAARRAPGVIAEHRLLHGDGLTLDDYYAIRQSLRGISGATVAASVVQATVQSPRHSRKALVAGMDVEGFAMRGRHVLDGTIFGSIDVQRAASVCVLTKFTAEELFPDDTSRIGKIVRVNDIPFVVVGVVDDLDPELLGISASGEPRDLEVLVPYSSLLARLDRDAPLNIQVSAESPEALGVVERDIHDAIESRRANRRAEFRTFNSAEAQQVYMEGSQTMAKLLSAVAGVSLLVGGIGIMNTMLVSVTERTREIGIRIAIGTRRRDVLRQFLVESALLSVLGGCIGIAVGIGAAWEITHLNGWPTRITHEAVLVAFFCSAAVGIVFGYHPARLAATLDPVESLRSE